MNLIHGRVLITGAEDVTLRLLLFVVYEGLFSIYSVSQVEYSSISVTVVVLLFI